ncbi:chromate efflux transporter [Thalassotalea aquiviva]|uniref:chromate efflux transporter n=1 Tax=Thalassotalea aquiviva TaxID=3242415 RepID=UPI00352A44E3
MRLTNALEVFWRFLLLGCISFGGPAAHIGYFQKAFVERLGWVSQSDYAQLIALSQFLPGPGSSQVGFAIGYQRAGLMGGIGAFLGFTLPSFVLLYCLAVLSLAHIDNSLYQGVITGLKLLAVIVVTDAVLTMFSSFCQQAHTRFICVLSAVAVLVFPSLITQVVVLFSAGVMAMFIAKLTINKTTAPANSTPSNTAFSKTQTLKTLPLLLFIALFVGLPFLSDDASWWALFTDFYQSGSLVFGGGHVVLPLLQETVGQSIDTERFLTGYALAQAVPGPMFSLAAFLGAEQIPEHALLAALLATLAIFLPGFLLLLSFQNVWQSFANKPNAKHFIQGINASVVGFIVAVLYQPVFVSAVTSAFAMAVVLMGIFLLRQLKWHIGYLVLLFLALGAGLSLIP